MGLCVQEIYSFFFFEWLCHKMGPAWIPMLSWPMAPLTYWPLAVVPQIWYFGKKRREGGKQAWVVLPWILQKSLHLREWQVQVCTTKEGIDSQGYRERWTRSIPLISDVSWHVRIRLCFLPRLYLLYCKLFDKGQVLLAMGGTCIYLEFLSFM